MLPPKLRRPFRHVTLVALALVFPLLYIGGVTLESGEVAGAALGLTALVALMAILSY